MRPIGLVYRTHNNYLFFVLYPSVSVDYGLPTTTTTTFRVHYQTALVACQIIANNAFATGRLTLDQAGQQLVDLPLDGILTEDTYYFFVGDSPGG